MANRAFHKDSTKAVGACVCGVVQAEEDETRREWMEEQRKPGQKKEVHGRGRPPPASFFLCAGKHSAAEPGKGRCTGEVGAAATREGTMRRT